jgi:hypothetical protein
MQAESPGIISRSIANANAEKSPITPARGQENVSLLQQQASKKSSPASTQFTFTCDSQVPGTIAWPGPSTTSMHQSPAARGLSTQATQTSPNMPSAPHAAEKAKQGLAAPQPPTTAQKQSQAPAEPAKKPRRRAGKENLIAARQRRHAQQFKNYHNPPAPEDIWICEFCEYERIFGSPPRALIRQYEIKDKLAKKKEAEKRRLLEKAKMKGRKKKGNKVTPKSSQAAQQPQSQQPQPPSMNQSHSQGTQSEEYYEDEYDDEYAQDDPPPPSPVAPPAARRNEVAQPDPGKQSGLQGVATPDTRITA